MAGRAAAYQVLCSHRAADYCVGSEAVILRMSAIGQKRTLMNALIIVDLLAGIQR